MREKNASQERLKSVHSPLKYRNSNVISFGRGHFSLYKDSGTHKEEEQIDEETEKSNKENNDKAEIKLPKSEVNKKNESPTSKAGCSSPDDKKEDYSDQEIRMKIKFNEDKDGLSDQGVLNKSKGIQKTLYDLISKFYLIKKFASNLRNATIYRRPKWLNSTHFQMKVYCLL